MSGLIDKLLDWCDKNGHASYGEMVERGCAALLLLSAAAGVGTGLLIGFMVVR